MYWLSFLGVIITLVSLICFRHNYPHNVVLLSAFTLAMSFMMIYFVFVASVLGQQVAPNGAVIELIGQTPRVIYGQLDASDALTLTRNASEDKLVCSGEFEAADLRIAGTSTTVADLIGEVAALRQEIGEVATLRQELAAVKAFVGMMPPTQPPPSSPPALPPAQTTCLSNCRLQSSAMPVQADIAACCEYDSLSGGCIFQPHRWVHGGTVFSGYLAANCYSDGRCDGWNQDRRCFGPG